MTNVNEHHNYSLNIFQSAAHYTNVLFFLEQPIIFLLLETYGSFSFLFYFLQKFLFLLLKETHYLFSENELALYFTFSIV